MIGKAYPCLVDFDNHLDDLSLDWLNPEINKVVDNATVQIQEWNCLMKSLNSIATYMYPTSQNNITIIHIKLFTK